MWLFLGLLAFWGFIVWYGTKIEKKKKSMGIKSKPRGRGDYFGYGMDPTDVATYEDD